MPHALHPSGSPFFCAVQGEKWTMTKWIHAEPFRWHPPLPPPSKGGCRDQNPTCKAWALSGECASNPGYMVGDRNKPGACVKACKKCSELGMPQ